MNPLFLLFPVIFPIAGGAFLLTGRISQKEDRKRNLYSESVVCITSVLVFTALLFVKREPCEVYSFVRGFSIAFGVDGLGSLFAGMVSVMWPLVMLYAFAYMKATEEKNKFYAFYVMTYGVTLGIAFASNITTLYVFFEMLTLVTIPLVSYYKDHESMFAGRKYAAYTFFGAGLAFLAVVITTIHGNAGAFAYGGSLSGTGPALFMQSAFLFGLFGFGAKAAVFPLHGWLPTASAAPTPVTALLHAVAVVNSGVFACMRLCWYIYGPDYLLGTGVLTAALVTVCFSMVFSAAMALKERHFKRRLAYSTASNLSYMLFGVLLMTPEGFLGGLLHMLFHGIIKMTLFLCAGAFMHMTGNAYIYQVNGAGKKMPATFSFYTLAALSLTGIPLFCGFISKWALVMAGIRADTKWAVLGVASLIISAFLCAMYTLSVSIRAFFPVSGKDYYAKAGGIMETPVLMLIPIVIFGILNLVFGIHSAPVLAFLSKIAEGIL